MINTRCFLGLVAAALTVTIYADVPGKHHAPPPPPPIRGPHGKVLPPHAKWCSKCEGYGYNRAWYGAKKFCHICDGKGWVALPPPPPPKPIVKKPLPPPPPPKPIVKKPLPPSPPPKHGKPGPR